MNTDHSAREYHPTIIESRFLIRRLAIQIDYVKDELKRNWVDFKSNPVVFARRSGREAFRNLNKLLLTPNAVPACLTAVAAIAALVLLALLIERTSPFREQPLESSGPDVELVLLNISKPPDSRSKPSIGKDGPGRVGFQNSKGEGSGDVRRNSGGGGGGGNGNPKPPQVGKLPPPSAIAAAIPIAPPVHPPALPVAGIDIDPALWKDLKAPVYGDPRSKSEIPSNGPGDGEGIGTNRGTGIGGGFGPGVWEGKDGNIGGGSKQSGCCGPGGGSDRTDGTFRGAEVEQRARLLYKPEPQYTEEARRNQITGTVMLRVVFSSAGEVVQIRAVRTLPFGLTERAIAAARQIKFVPAMKGGRAVSVFMQLEYNFNLY